MNKTLKKTFVILLASFIVAILVVVISCLLLQNASFVINLFLGLLVFITVAFFASKFIEMLSPITASDKKNAHLKNENVTEGIFEISNYVEIDYRINKSANIELISLTENKKFFVLCDAISNKTATEIVNNVATSIIEFISNSDNVQRTMKLIDSALQGLNMNNVHVDMILGLIDLDEMTLKYVNASCYDVFIFQNTTKDAEHVPLISNKYEMLSKTTSKFIASEYPIKVDDVILIKALEKK